MSNTTNLIKYGGLQRDEFQHVATNENNACFEQYLPISVLVLTWLAQLYGFDSCEYWFKRSILLASIYVYCRCSGFKENKKQKVSVGKYIHCNLFTLLQKKNMALF